MERPKGRPVTRAIQPVEEVEAAALGVRDGLGHNGTRGPKERLKTVSKQKGATVI